MSTHYYVSRMRKGIRLASLVLLSVLGVLGIALQALLFSSSPAIASSVHRVVNAPPSEEVAHAGPSLVRLVVTYNSTLTSPATIIQCRGLGTIVASWPAQNPADQNTWVLTDGSLVNPGGEAICVTVPLKAKLASIEVLLSTAYSPDLVTAPTSSPVVVHRSTAGACQHGAGLFAFSMQQTLPFLALMSVVLPSAPPIRIELSKTSAALLVPPSSKVMASAANPASVPQGSTGSNSGKSGNNSLMAVLWGMVILLVLLLAVVIIVGLRMRKRAQEHREFQEDLVEAERIASATLEEEMRKQRRAWAQQHQAQKLVSEQTTLTPELSPQAFGQPTTNPLPCPNCYKAVPRGATRCPYCGASMLSPTDSGFYPRTQFAIPPYVSASRPPNGVENQPTREMSPSLQQLSPSEPRNGVTDPETTQQSMRSGKNQHLGFSVVTRTNVGKKRKHKPNEDSLFAAQGVREASHVMQQVGLFVVADGMGGHANGQDASQLAIQSIINYILPRLGQSGELSADVYKQLLTEGVQCANLAVHQRNLEQRADMGTTMTAALVVAPLGQTYAEDDTRPPAAIAYVANVGDSRTYLYRKTKGLSKLTNDHSVVASLVEAGIIRPDDIYTHPKRNQIYRSLGEKPTVEVDGFMYPLEVDDKLLLCSDGLWDMVRDPKIEEVLKSYEPDPNLTGDMLIQAALDGGGEDNVSVIVVHIPDLSRQDATLGIQLIDKPGAVQMPPM